MGLRKRLVSVVVVAALLIGLIYVGKNSKVLQGVIPEDALTQKETIYIWYTDEALDNYLAGAALEFSEENDVRVIPVLTSGLEYLEAIHEASMDGQSSPDMYIISNDALEKAYLAGLADPIEDPAGLVTEDNFCAAALSAVTYQDKLVGYPFYFETSALVYNESHLKEAASAYAVAAADAAAGEAAQEAADNGEIETEIVVEEETEELIVPSVEELIPGTLEELLSFADTYDAPSTVEAIFKWDVSDIFYNYFFAGNYISVGGPNGDDSSLINIYNLEAIKGLQAYQQMNQFFFIEADEVDYESVVKEFQEGKLLFTVCTTDILTYLEEASKVGHFLYDYDITTLPDVNEDIKTRSLSVTNAVVISGYSDKQEIANAFAAYLTGERAERLYEQTGKLSSNNEVVYDNERAEAFREEYADSAPITKLMSASNFWVQMEIAYTKIWSGADVSLTLKELSEQIMGQVTGEVYEEKYIKAPEIETYEEN